MMNRMKSLVASESGQGMTEYIIIVALIAIAAIGIITVFGQNLRALFATSASMLGGSTSRTLAASNSAGSNVGTGVKRISNFSNYGN